VGSHGTVPLGDIWEMLDHCAQGYRKVEKPHNWWVYFGKSVYTDLSLGKHGARKNPEIQIGQVKHMCRLSGSWSAPRR